MPTQRTIRLLNAAFRSNAFFQKFCRHLPALLLFLFGAASSIAQTRSLQDRSDDSFQQALDHGVDAFKAGQFALAIAYFQSALIFDPSSQQARLDLGTAYAASVIPGLNTPDNSKTVEDAIYNPKDIPRGSTEYPVALKQIAFIYYHLHKIPEARKSFLELLDDFPEDVEAHYTIGVIDWTEAHKNTLDALAKQNLLDDGEGNTALNASACVELRILNSPLVQDGLEHLLRAIELRPTYDDAMAYLNLTYRRRADLSCGDKEQTQADVAEANEWGKKAMQTRKQNEISQARGPFVDSNR